MTRQAIVTCDGDGCIYAVQVAALQQTVATFELSDQGWSTVATEGGRIIDLCPACTLAHQVAQDA